MSLKGAPKYAIPIHVAAIAVSYIKDGKRTVSRGIQEMHRQLQEKAQ